MTPYFFVEFLVIFFKKGKKRMLEKYLQEYKNAFNEPFPLMLCRGCDDIEIIELIIECIEAHTPYTVENNLDY